MGHYIRVISSFFGNTLLGEMGLNQSHIGTNNFTARARTLVISHVLDVDQGFIINSSVVYDGPYRTKSRYICPRVVIRHEHRDPPWTVVSQRELP